MIVIDIKFSSKGKIYKYLLINPGNFKVDKTIPLIEVKGIIRGTVLNSYLYIDNIQRVDELPKVVTKQIVILDNNNNVRTENLGYSTIPIPSREVTPAPEPPKTVVAKKKTKFTKKKPLFSTLTISENRLKKILYGN